MLAPLILTTIAAFGLADGRGPSALRLEVAPSRERRPTLVHSAPRGDTPCEVSVDENPNLELVQGGLACVSFGLSTAARFAKSHDLSTAFPPGDAVLSCLEFGWTCSGGPLEVGVELHLDVDGGDLGPEGEDLVLLDRQLVTLPSATLGMVRVPLTKPATVSADRTVVVVIDVPASEDGVASFAGGIDDDADATWFILPDCGIETWRLFDPSSIPLDWVVRIHGRPDSGAVCTSCIFDCDGDGIGDREEISMGASDCDGDLVPDACGLFDDCDDDGIPDACQSEDCNGNGVPDICDVTAGTVRDCDGNLVPDACDILGGGRDLDRDGVLDCCVDAEVVCRPGPPEPVDDATWIRVRRDPPPPSFQEQTLVRAGDRWLLLGGAADDGESLGRSWELVDGGWRFLSEGPSPRTGVGAASWDGGALMFGGRSFSETYADSWRFDPDDGWMALEIPGPSPRAGHAMVAWDGGALLFGGRDGGGELLGDLWWFDGQAWIEIEGVVGPSARAEHVLCFDRRSGDVVLHGGIGAKGPLADTWSFDGVSWRLRARSSGPGGGSVGMASLPESFGLVAIKDSATWLFRDDRWHPWTIRGDEDGFGPAPGASVASEPGRNAARIVGGDVAAEGWSEVVLSAARYPYRDCDGDFLEDHDAIEIATELDCDLDGRLDACSDGIDCPDGATDVDCALQPTYGAAGIEPDDNYGWSLDDVSSVHALWIRRFKVRSDCPIPDSVWVWWDPESFEGRSARIAVLSDPDGDGRPYDAEPVGERFVPLISGVSGWRRYVMPAMQPGPIDAHFYVAIEIQEATFGDDSPMSVVRRDLLTGESAWVAASSQPFDLGDLDGSADVWPVVPLSTTTGLDTWFMIAAGCGHPSDLDGDFIPDECDVCPADLVGLTGVVDVFDLEQVLLGWGSDSPIVDLDGDGIVDGRDLAAVLVAWGPCGD